MIINHFLYPSTEDTTTSTSESDAEKATLGRNSTTLSVSPLSKPADSRMPSISEGPEVRQHTQSPETANDALPDGTTASQIALPEPYHPLVNRT